MESIDWDDVEKKCEEFIPKLVPVSLVKEDLAVFPYMKRMNANTIDLMNLFNLISPSLENIKSLSLLLLIIIFGLIEGSFTLWINICIFQLVRMGHHDLWDEIRQKFVTSFDEIANIRLAVKLSFVKSHGLDFIDKFANRELRNAFAHQNYLINDEGVVSIYRNQICIRKYTFEDLGNIITIIQKYLELNTRIMVKMMGMDFDDFVNMMDNVKIEDLEELTKHLAETLDKRNESL